MKAIEIIQHLRTQNFGKHADVIESQAERCVGFKMISTDENEIALGCSKAGGSPDLPPDYSWPTYRERPLDFLVQINLEDVASFQLCHDLPQRGLISVFYAAASQPWGYDPTHRRRWKVLYFPEAERCSNRLAFPDGAVFWKFRPCVLEFSDVFCRGWMNIAQEALGLDQENAKAFREAVYDMPTHFQSQLLGHTYGIQSSEEEMQRQCQWTSNGVYCGGGGGYLFDEKRAKELEPGAQDWRLLLRLSSDDNAAMEWGDFGELYFWIRDEDLRQREFSDVWVILECA